MGRGPKPLDEGFTRLSRGSLPAHDVRVAADGARCPEALAQRPAAGLRYAIDAAFRDAKIEMPFPQRVVHTADASALPILPRT
jgi:hypothetical protein